MRKTMKCFVCGSGDVVRDAWAAWNEDKQEWELANVFDDAFCNDCESSTHIEDAPIEP